VTAISVGGIGDLYFMRGSSADDVVSKYR